MVACGPIMHTLTSMNWKYRWVQQMPLLTVGIGALVIFVIAAGPLDPQPVGPLRWAETRLLVNVEAGSPTVEWLQHDLPPESFSIRLSAALASGKPDIGYGLIIRDSLNAMVISISPSGYVSIWQQELAALGEVASVDEILKWQPWPHIASDNDANEIWIDVQGRLVTVRVNREVLWSGSVSGNWQQAGLWTESFGPAAAVDFAQFELFSP